MLSTENLYVEYLNWDSQLFGKKICKITKDKLDENQLARCIEWAKIYNIENHLFLFSASTFTNLAIYELYQKYPNNTFIDIGTCLTPMMDMPTHRGYLEAFWGYGGGPDIQKICVC
jgi:hypothetical protein